MNPETEKPTQQDRSETWPMVTLLLGIMAMVVAILYILVNSGC